ncbi:methionine ABC transporter ATP-binding protein [Brevibacillus humidisoli]|uniref:methionine ABC transporter ATP-binding protein n=1 Tax=Brevibacillus humidisoli TaxID=2895522 RepID=UPI001E38FA76|nr:methionine ABC transporter ATP-binding protein [Brevibacillus humidisoli]UFJ40921.1 methionine ABC transporter ATP-binding protein [Brevibacillus humidisoli]
MITLSNVVKTFANRFGSFTALNGIDLTIQKGEIFGIIGYSGAGKSTLVRMINMLETPTSGEVSVGETKLNQLSFRELRRARRKIGMVFQHFNLLWSRTVAENVALPLEIAGIPKKEHAARVTELLNLVGLADKADAYPSQLSGGQKQRVGIARALANQPDVLLCDEATSALDPKTTDSILELLREINRKLGLTVVLITHEMHVIEKICDRVAVMESGRIIEMGDVVDVFSHPKTTTTRELISQVAGSEQPDEEFLQGLEGGAVLRCTFLGEAANQTMISRLVTELGVEVNILQGQIKRLKDIAFGTLYIQIPGDVEVEARTIAFLKKQGIKVEVLRGAEGGAK